MEEIERFVPLATPWPKGVNSAELGQVTEDTRYRYICARIKRICQRRLIIIGQSNIFFFFYFCILYVSIHVAICNIFYLYL